MPGSIQRAKKSGSIVLEAHIAMSAPAIAASGFSTGNFHAKRRTHLAEKASRLALVGLKQRMDLILRAAVTAMSCVPSAPPRAKDADGLGVLACEIFHTEAVRGTDADALHDSVRHDRERLSVLD
jgi:hypothetical protein